MTALTVNDARNPQPSWQETHMSNRTQHPIQIDVNHRGRSPDPVE